MADCWDCMYSVMKGQVLKCKRKGTDVSERSSICSNFADSNANAVMIASTMSLAYSVVGTIMENVS